MKNYPKARAKDIVVSDYKNEVLIYDLKTHKCHSLNKTASSIWQECNGERDVVEIAKRLYDDTAKKIREDLVTLTLSELGKVGLMETDEGLEFNSRIARRKMIKSVGMASMIALPIVASITAPEASHAQSGCATVVCGPNCCPAGNVCGSGNQCCPQPTNCGNIPNGCPCSLSCSGCSGSVCNTVTGFCQAG